MNPDDFDDPVTFTLGSSLDDFGIELNIPTTTGWMPLILHRYHVPMITNPHEWANHVTFHSALSSDTNFSTLYLIYNHDLQK